MWGLADLHVTVVERFLNGHDLHGRANGATARGEPGGLILLFVLLIEDAERPGAARRGDFDRLEDLVDGFGYALIERNFRGL